MGLLKKFGRQVEQFKQTATDAAEENADYRCEECDARFNAGSDRCPECGSEAVASVEE